MTTTMRSAVAVVAAIGMALILAVAGCGPGMFGPSGTAAASQPVLVTEQVAPSALLAVTSARRGERRAVPGPLRHRPAASAPGHRPGGHGASNLVAVGPSGQNRRVVVVIEEPTGATRPR